MTVRSLTSQPQLPSGVGDASDSIAGGLARPDHSHQYHQDPVPLTLANGYVGNASYDGPDLFKVGNFVQVRGVVSGPILAVGVPFLQIPVAYLPMRTPIRFGVASRSTPFDSRFLHLISISSGGLVSFVYPEQAMSWMSLYNLRWLFK